MRMELFSAEKSDIHKSINFTKKWQSIDVVNSKAIDELINFSLILKYATS